MTATIQSAPERFRELVRVAPAELDAELQRLAVRDVLPVARSLAGGGRLASGLRVTEARDRIVFEDRLPHANVQHYGGQTWYARSRVGEAARKASLSRGNRAIKGKRFVERAVEDNPKFLADVLTALEDLTASHFS